MSLMPLLVTYLELTSVTLAVAVFTVSGFITSGNIEWLLRQEEIITFFYNEFFFSSEMILWRN